MTIEEGLLMLNEFIDIFFKINIWWKLQYLKRE